DHVQVLAELPRLYARADADCRTRIVAQYSRHVAALARRADHDGDGSVLTHYVEAHHTALSDDTLANLPVAEALLVLGRFDEVLTRFPTDNGSVAGALSYEGRLQEVVDRFPSQPTIVIQALQEMGRSLEITERYPDVGEDSVPALLERGELAGANALDPKNSAVLYAMGRIDDLASMTPPNLSALIVLNRTDEVPEQGRDYYMFLLATGQYQRAYDLHGHDNYFGGYVRAALGLDCWIAGDHDRARALFAPDPIHEFRNGCPCDITYAMIPFLLELGGDRDAFPRIFTAFEDPKRRWMLAQKPWHIVSYHAGRLTDQQMLAQADKLFAESRLLFSRGVASERAGRPADALRDYRARLAMPMWKRGWPDPVLDRFVAWRIAQLGP
ncbi:MAG: hypothetical protein H0W83_09585, partial [Planctomycetes bacterium]|nr:hypothetical protein [Planctomycetota bacterium]